MDKIVPIDVTLNKAGGGISLVISSIRFPLAVLVVATHSFVLQNDLELLYHNPEAVVRYTEFIKLFIGKVLGNCPVPIFYFISGYLFFNGVSTHYKKSIYVNKLHKRVGSLLIPYLLWITIYILYILLQKTCGVVFHNKPIDGIVIFLTDKGLSAYWDCLVFPGLIDWAGSPHYQTAPLLGPLWYLRDLMIVCILSPLFFPLIRTSVWPLIAILIYASGMIPVWLSATMLPAFCFFTIGAWFQLKNRDFVFVIYKFRWIICSIAVFLCAITTFHGSNIGDRTGQLLFPFAIIFTSASLILLTSMVVQHYNAKKLMSLAPATMFIYCSHYFVVQEIYKMTRMLFLHFSSIINVPYIDLLTYLFTIAMCVLICVMIYQLLNKYTPSLCNVLSGKMKYNHQSK